VCLLAVAIASLARLTLLGSPESLQVARLSGVVVDDAGTPVPRATASLFPAGADPSASPIRTASTDADGRFAFEAVPAGTYRVTAKKLSYLEGAYGRTRPAGSFASIQVANGDNRTAIRISLWRTAVITGRVVDDDGEEVVGAAVEFLERVYVAGRRQFVRRASAATNDRGEFRSPPLTPSEFVVCVPRSQETVPESVVDAFRGGTLAISPAIREQLARLRRLFELPAGSDSLRLKGTVWRIEGGGTDAPALDGTKGRVLRTVYYPAGRGPTDAALLRLKSGEERSGVVVELPSEASVRVVGILRSSDGPQANVAIRLVSESHSDVMDDNGFESGLSLTDGSGTFVFTAVPAGDYTLSAVASTAGPSRLWASERVTVGSTDLEDLEIALHEALQIHGRVQLLRTATGATAPITQREVSATRLVLEPANGRQLNLPAASLAADGTFTFAGLQPGRYFVRVRAAPAGWTLRDALLKDVDISDEPLDVKDRDQDGIVVTFTDRPSEVAGVVIQQGGKPDPAAMVAVFPVDQRFWRDFGWAPRRLKTIPTGGSGEYSIAGLPPGEYYLAAYPAEAEYWQDIEGMFEVLSRSGQRIDINSGESKRNTLTTIVRR